VSFPAPVALTVARPLRRRRRPYGGPVTTLTLAGGPPLRVTPAHPILTHAGWRRADILVPGVHVVATDLPGVDADAAYEADREVYGEHRVPGERGSKESCIVCLDPAAWPPGRPHAGDEGADPGVDPATVQYVLDGLCTTAEFGVVTWAQACDRIPGLAEIYPTGPVVRHDGIGEDVRRRLGTALAALPAPPLDRAALGQRLLGIPAPLHLVEVTGVEVGPTTALVHDVATAAGCLAMDGVVVGA
jgi:hypothetical protein